MEYYYKEPCYFKNFKCTGGQCPYSCCDGWRIFWHKTEVNKVKNSNCSKYLQNLANRYFTETETAGLYKVSMVAESIESGKEGITVEDFIEHSRCPFHNKETGLCDIQKELGEGYLGTVCTRYPRRYFQRQQVVVRSCSSSCHAVNELLVNDKNAAVFEMRLARDFDKLEDTAVRHDKQTAVEHSPYLKRRIDILDFYTELFNSLESIENSIVFGALAAKKISEASPDDIPAVLKEYRKQFGAPSVLRSIEEIESNYRIKFMIVNNLIYEYFGTRKDGIDISFFHDGEKLITERYLEGKEKFYKIFENREFALRNIAINMFVDIFMHLNLTQYSFFDMYSVFTSFVAVLQVFAYATGYQCNEAEKEFIKVTSILNRAMSHNMDRAEKVLNYIKKIGLTSPAHLALIIK